MSELEPLLDTDDVSVITGRSVDTLRRDVQRRQGIPFIRIGRLVRYRRSDIEAYLNAGRVVPQPIVGARTA